MAYLYDKLMDHAPYDEWAAFTQKAFERSGKHIKKIADLGCGTGEITMKLAEAGYNMTGVDYSEEMLTYAQQKASETNYSIQWICQDLREIQGLTNLDAAVSYCDVINYITAQDELKAVFKSVASALKEGGMFLFDVHSMNYVEEKLKNHTFADVTDDASYIWFCTEGENTGEMYHDLTFFTLSGENYERFDEYHHQRTYPVEFFQRLLNESGFQNTRIYADFQLDNNSLENAERIFFITEKRSE
ncbi:class I SAM-dependent DNA methyltransferase [Virgibacillus ainsalahensis]